MRRLTTMLLEGLLGVLLAMTLVAQVTPARLETRDMEIRFLPVEVIVDTGDRPLAAYQLTMRATRGDVRIVGIEGSKPGSVFTDPPYYDPRAMQRDHVIIADFSVAPAGDLPRGRIRVATVHVRVAGDEAPAFQAELTAAADDTGAPIDATTSLVFGDDR